MSSSLRALRFVLLAILLAAPATVARASHYALSKVDLVTAGERGLLARAGIHDTEVLLRWVATRKSRTWLTRQTGLTEARLFVLATRCDLLRITGIGPTIAESLQRAEVLDTHDLARDSAAELLARLRIATRGTTMANKLPAEDTLATWIAGARRLSTVLDFDPWDVEAVVAQVKTGRVAAPVAPPDR